MMARRISGSEGCGGGPLGSSFFPPARGLQPPVLQIGEGDAGHQRVPMQAGPGPAFEVAGAELSLSCWCTCSQDQRALTVAASRRTEARCGRLLT
jgi:hypothetical protein